MNYFDTSLRRIATWRTPVFDRYRDYSLDSVFTYLRLVSPTSRVVGQSTTICAL